MLFEIRIFINQYIQEQWLSWLCRFLISFCFYFPCLVAFSFVCLFVCLFTANVAWNFYFKIFSMERTFIKTREINYKQRTLGNVSILKRKNMFIFFFCNEYGLEWIFFTLSLFRLHLQFFIKLFYIKKKNPPHFKNF